VTAEQAPGWLRRLAGRLDQIDLVFPRSAVPPEGGRRSAVLILFGPAQDGSGADVLLTQRAPDLRAHAGQVAFPGGAMDPDDDGPVGAALREAWEETGLVTEGVEVLGALPDLYLPPSGYVVTPVLAWWARPSAVGPVDPEEVARVVRVPLGEILDPANRFTVQHPSGYVGPGFAVRELFVWGFTAGLLARILSEAGVEVPWDRAKLVPLPDPLAVDPVSVRQERE
jgi:8-oxo-dGTP pyrophosphatase MutT (NUDIX family)